MSKSRIDFDYGDLSEAEAVQYISNKIIGSIPVELVSAGREKALRDAADSCALEITRSYVLHNKKWRG